MVILLAALPVLLGASTPAARLAELAGFTPRDQARLSAGQLVGKVPESPDRTEITAAAAVRVNTTREQFLACARDPRCLKGNDDVLQIGRLDTAAPGPQDLASRRLDPRQIQALQKCRPGRCGLRLSADSIARIDAVDWSSASAAAAAQTVFRELLAQRAASYLSGGDAALPPYADGPRPVSPEAERRVLLRRPWPWADDGSRVLAHLESYPRAPLPGAEEYVFWSAERYYRKTLVSLSHVAILDASGPAGARVYVAVKQLYASHYLYGSVETFAFDGADGSSPGVLAFLSRVRTDIRPSGFTWLERVILNRLVGGRLEDQFGSLRQRLEGRTAAGPPSGPGVASRHPRVTARSPCRRTGHVRCAMFSQEDHQS
jgi:hypothetical protein